MNAQSTNAHPGPAFTGGAFFCALVLALFAGVSGCAADGEERNGEVAAASPGAAVFASSSVFIGPAELEQMLDDPDLVLLHVGHGDRGYTRGHLSGALYVDFEETAVERGGLKLELPDTGVLTEMMRGLGIDDGSQIVLYGDASGVFPARMYLTLEALGLGDRARLLDGQLRGWVSEGRVVTAESSQRPAVSLWEPMSRRGVIASAADVERALADGEAVVVDVRPTGQFDGSKRGPDTARAGRIEGAVSVPWLSLLASKLPPWLHAEDELRARLAAAGVGPGSRVIVYDNSGIHAPVVYAVLKQLGHEVSLYDGGFEQWSRRPITPADSAAAE